MKLSLIPFLDFASDIPTMTNNYYFRNFKKAVVKQINNLLVFTLNPIPGKSQTSHQSTGKVALQLRWDN